jgi:hypothetical protein
MFPAAGSHISVDILSVDPTDHGSNFGMVAVLAVGILVLIGVIVFLITRRGRRGPGRG